MDNYKRMYKLLIEGVDKEAFKDFWSQHEKAGARRAKPTRASKKTQAAAERARRREANQANKEATGGTYQQQRGKQ